MLNVLPNIWRRDVGTGVVGPQTALFLSISAAAGDITYVGKRRLNPKALRQRLGTHSKPDEGQTRRNFFKRRLLLGIELHGVGSP